MGKVFSFFSVAGGVGKTFLAVNTAISLVRETDGQILLVDFSLPPAKGINFYLDLPRLRSVCQVVSAMGSVNEKLLRTFPVVADNGVRVLNMHSGEGDVIDALERMEECVDVLEKLVAAFDYVVFDIAMSYGSHVERVLEWSNKIVVPFEATPPSMLSFNNTCELLKQNNFSKGRLFPVLNKVVKKDFLGQAGIEKSIRKGIEGMVSFDPDFYKKYTAKINYVSNAPDHVVSKGIIEISVKLLHVEAFPAQKKTITAEGVGELITKDEKNQLKALIHAELLKVIDLKQLDVMEAENDPEMYQELQDKVRTTTINILDEITHIDSRSLRNTIVREILQEALGLGVLEDFLADEEISEIMVNRWNQIYFEKFGKLHLSDETFISEQQLRAIIDRIVTPLGRRIDTASPMVDARLKNGSRVNAVIPPLAVKGAALTIRKFETDALGLEELIQYGSLNRQLGEFLKAVVHCRLNIIVSGGTGSGKTTLLNVLSSFIPEDERIITIEDSAELQLRQPHAVTMESRPPNIEGQGEVTIRDLVRNALRMRPDRIVVGECRSGEALDMLQAMNTGHDGSLTTLHSNSPKDSLSRLETLVLFSGFELPIRAIREQIAGAIDIIIQVSRMNDGSRKILNVTEVTGGDGEDIYLEDVYEFQVDGNDENGKVRGTFTATGYTPKCLEKFEEHGIMMPKELFWKTT